MGYHNHWTRVEKDKPYYTGPLPPSPKFSVQSRYYARYIRHNVYLCQSGVNGVAGIIHLLLKSLESQIYIASINLSDIIYGSL